MTRPSSPPSKPSKSSTIRTEPLAGKLFPPSSPVDVPRRPPAVPAAKVTDSLPAAPAATRTAALTADDEGGYAHANANQHIDPTRSSWADSTQPAPNKKNARSSLL